MGLAAYLDERKITTRYKIVAVAENSSLHAELLVYASLPTATIINNFYVIKFKIDIWLSKRNSKSKMGIKK